MRYATITMVRGPSEVQSVCDSTPIARTTTPARDARPPLASSPASPLVLTKKQVAGLLQVHERTVERMVRTGTLDKVPGLGTAVRIPREHVEMLIAGTMPHREVS